MESVREKVSELSELAVPMSDKVHLLSEYAVNV